MALISNQNDNGMKAVLFCFFIVALLALYSTSASAKNDYIDQIGSMMRQVMPLTANCATAQFPLHCEYDSPSFEFGVSIDSGGTADFYFKGTKREIEVNIFRAVLLFARIFAISRDQIEKCMNPLTLSGYNRDVILGQSGYKLNCTGVETSTGPYNAHIRRAIQQ